MAKRIYTEAEMNLITNPNESSKNIASILGVHPCTVDRKRKALGIKPVHGPKPGSDRSAWHRRETRTCVGENCNNKFEVILSHSKSWCSRSCFFIHNNPAHNGHVRKIRNPNMPNYIRYRNKVHALSQKVYEDNIDIINPKGYNRSRAGVKGGWQLDHIITVKESFELNIPPEKVAVLENLRMLPWKENLLRNRNNFKH